MSLKLRFKNFISRLSGYWILDKRHLPVGTDLYEDLRYKIAFIPEVVFDVGANIGQTAIEVHKQFPAAHIYSFEPVNGTFKELQNNTKNYPQVHCINTALGNTTGKKEIRLFSAPMSYLNSLRETAMNTEQEATSEIIEVITLDEFAGKNHIRRIDLLKIDSEGYELQILEGAKKMIADRKISMILCETGFSPDNKRNTYFPELLDLLIRQDYIFFGLYEMGYYKRISKDIKGGSQYGNALFILPEILDTFKDAFEESM